MFRALFLKEWRQLRTLRWAALILTTLLPLAFVLGAEAAKRGWWFGNLKDYSASTLWGDVLPGVLALGVWPLLLALAASHVLCAERQDGTEAFLLSRPLRRSHVWTAKTAAAAASWLAVVAFGLLVAGTLALRVLPQDKVVERAMWLAKGAATYGFVLGSAVFAAALVRSTVLAALLGVVFALGAMFVGFQVAILFPYAKLPEDDGRGLHAAYVFWLFAPGFLAASALGFWRGEPAGRGRARRAGITVAVTAAIVAVGFVAAAWGITRASVSVSPTSGWIVAPSRGMRFAVDVWPRARGVAIVDARGGSVVRFLRPPVEGARWNDDESALAVGSFAGPLGSVRDRMQVEVYSATGVQSGRPVALPTSFPWGAELHWQGAAVLALYPRLVGDHGVGFAWVLAFVEPGAGTMREVDLGERARFAWFEGPTDAGESFVVLTDYLHGDGESEQSGGGEWRLLRIDAASGTATPVDGIPVRSTSPAFRGTVSPSGRLLLARHRLDGDESSVIVDRSSGDVLDRPRLRSGIWLRGDLLVGVASDAVDAPVRIDLRLPDGTVSEIGRRPSGPCWLSAAPDRRRLLTTGERHAVWEADSGRWIDLPSVPGDPRTGSVQWAGPKTLAWRGPDYLVLADLDSLDKRRVVFGTDPFLKGAPAN